MTICKMDLAENYAQGDGSQLEICDNHDENFSRQKRILILDILEQYYTCPICYDTCVESTSTNCGHRFCKVCIETWVQKRPICPLCCQLITSKHRILNDDLLIEFQLDYLSVEVKDRFVTAQKSRLTTICNGQQNKVKRNRLRELKLGLYSFLSMILQVMVFVVVRACIGGYLGALVYIMFEGNSNKCKIWVTQPKQEPKSIYDFIQNLFQLVMQNEPRPVYDCFQYLFERVKKELS